MRYWPVSSLTTDLTFSIKTGLAASTVTPGSTAPDVSRTTPVMAACAYAAAGNSKKPTTIAAAFETSLFIAPLLDRRGQLLSSRAERRPVPNGDQADPVQ